jgi:hypothetical protein
VDEQVGFAQRGMRESIDYVSNCAHYEYDIVKRLNFLGEQFVLLFAAQPRYSADILFMAYRFVTVSISVCRRLRSTVLSLPHESYLKRLSNVFSLSGGLYDNAHATYNRKHEC